MMGKVSKTLRTKLNYRIHYRSFCPSPHTSRILSVSFTPRMDVHFNTIILLRTQERNGGTYDVSTPVTRQESTNRA